MWAEKYGQGCGEAGLHCSPGGAGVEAQDIPIARRAWQMEGEGGGECRDVVGMYEDGQECGLGKGSHSPGQCIAPRSLPLRLLPLGHGLWMLLLI